MNVRKFTAVSCVGILGYCLSAFQESNAQGQRDYHLERTQLLETARAEQYCPWTSASDLIREGRSRVKNLHTSNFHVVQPVKMETEARNAPEWAREAFEIFRNLLSSPDLKPLAQSFRFSLVIMSTQEPISAKTVGPHEVRVELATGLLQRLFAKLPRGSYRKAIRSFFGHEIGHFIAPVAPFDELAPISLESQKSRIRQHMIIDSIGMFLAELDPKEFADALGEIELFVKNDLKPNIETEISIRRNCFSRLE